MKKIDRDLYILGINAHHADASAAIFRNGVLLAAIEEERITRVKHWAGFPIHAMEFCLAEAGIGWTEIDGVAFGRNPKAKLGSKMAFLLKHPQAITKLLHGRLSNAAQSATVKTQLANIGYGKGVPQLAQKLHYIEHHRSHLASAFFASPFERAALLSIDGSGDFTTTMTGVGNDNQIEIHDSINFPHSLGVFYTAFTQLLGFPHYGDEYKVMGLAPYGKPTYFEELKQVVQWLPKGRFRLNAAFFRSAHQGYVSYDDQNIPQVPSLYTSHMEQQFLPYRFATQPLQAAHFNLAASVQKMLEETVFHILNYLHKQTGLTHLCLAGGVAQNSVANGKISQRTGFKHIYIPPAGHDAGLALGAAAYLYHHIWKQPRVPSIRQAYTGAAFSNQYIGEMLKRKNKNYQFFEDDQALFEYVAQAIANGAVVGWFRGKSEFGPRALGNRSILADPRRHDAKELLNTKIKRRESFRPFAPSVLAEFASDFFEQVEEAPFMERVFQIRPEKRDLIPAVTHVDGSGRIQTVSLENNIDFYRLIHNFMKLTSIPILLNTSFNENEPIVNRPEEALHCFDRTSMDLLVLENYVLIRP